MDCHRHLGIANKVRKEKVGRDLWVQRLLVLKIQIIYNCALLMMKRTDKSIDKSLTLNNVATYKRISSKWWRTTTNRVVVNNLTKSANSAGSWARIFTFLIGTSLILWTFGVHYTLRSANWWTTYVTNYTGTNGLTVHLSALAVRSTRWRWTYVPRS